MRAGEFTSPIPLLDSEQGLNRYLAEIRRFPYLSPEEELELALRYRDEDDGDAAARLITSHLRLVAKMAMRFRGYGLPTSELISEGNLGLLRGVRKFDPDRGFRVATYAMWWIRAQIQDYILRSWSLVKIGTTVGQKKLFFNLRRVKRTIEAYEDGDLTPGHVAKIAEDLGVTTSEVQFMNQRMSASDASLSIAIGEDGDGSWQDWLVDLDPLQDDLLAEREETVVRHDLLAEAMDGLNAREKHILAERRLAEEPKTLETLSVQYGVSRERVRQIEVRAFEKLQRSMLQLAGGRGLLAVAA